MEDKKQYIVKCAHQLFKEKGYLDTSIQNILEAADVSKGTFYKYFLQRAYPDSGIEEMDCGEEIKLLSINVVLV